MGLNIPFRSLLNAGAFNRPARLFLVAIIIDGIVYSIWQLFFNLYILASGFDKEFLGLINSMPYIAALLFGIPLGVLSDRIGRRRAMLLGVLVSTLGYAVQIIIHSPGWMLIAAFLAGLGFNLYLISQAPFMMAVSNEQTRVQLFSLNFGLNTISGVIGSLIAGQLPVLLLYVSGVVPGSADPYRFVLLGSVILSSLAMIPLFMIHEPARSTHAIAIPFSKLKNLLFSRIIWLLFLPNLLAGFGAAILMPYMNVFFVEKFSTSDQILGLLFGTGALFTGIGSILAPRLAVYLRSKIKAVILSQSTSLIFLILMGFTPISWLAGLSYLARNTLMNLGVPLFSAFSMEQIPADVHGTANSILNISWILGWAVGPFLSGLIQERYGFTPLFITTAFFYGISILLIGVIFLKKENFNTTALIHQDEITIAHS